MSRHSPVGLGDVLLVCAGLSLVLSAFPAGQSAIVRLQKAIPFHGGAIVGYEKSNVLTSDGGPEWRPSQPDHLFLTLKLEVRAPFEYRRGTFRELILIDDSNRIYQHRGMLTGKGWVQFDDATGVEPTAVLATMELKTYPGYLDVHFEVPSTITTLSLLVGNSSQTLFAPSLK